jgi:periplasmic protein TonB
MREAVSDVLASRAREADGLSRMVLYSLVAHAVLVGLVTIVPGGWISSPPEPEVTPVMISLEGAPGQDTGGRTQVTARRVQEVAPVTKQPFTPPPAAKLPEMVVPEPAAKSAPKPRTVEKPADKSTARKPATGEKVTSGESRVDTRGAAVPFGGLSTSGGTGLNVQGFGLTDFCCPEYLDTMAQLIRRQWNQDQGAAGSVVVKYTIRRDGMLTQIEVVKPSGNFILDQESRRAVIKTAQLPPLPSLYTGQNLTIHLTFEYQR